MSNELNGYELSRQWFDFCFENPEKVKPKHTAIYFFAIEHCNRLGWKKKFGFPSQMAMEAIGISSWKTYSDAFNEIVEWGFFELIERSKNQYSSNIIALVKNAKAHAKALDKALKNHTPKHCRSTVSINKQDNKGTKNNEPYTDEFDAFWELYDVKKGKKKAWLEWKKLTEPERAKIMENIPIFLTHFSSEQFTPRPRKYLYNRYWEDEGYQQPNKQKSQNNGTTHSRPDAGEIETEYTRDSLAEFEGNLN